MTLFAFTKCYYEKIRPLTKAAKPKAKASSVRKSRSTHRSLKKGPSQYLSSGRPALAGGSMNDGFARGVHFDALDHHELAHIAAQQGNNKAAVEHLNQASSLMRMSPQQHLDMMRDHIKQGNSVDDVSHSNGHFDAALNHGYLYGVKTGNWDHYQGNAEQSHLDHAHQQYKMSGQATGAAHVNPLGRDSM